MKRFSAILLLFLLLLFVGRFLVFTSYIKSQKSDFRKTVLNANTKAIVTLEIPIAELYKNTKGLEWKEKNRELVIHGKYHDVVRIEKGKRSATIYLLPDTKENELYANYFETQNSNKDTHHFLKLFLSLQFYCPASENSFTIPIEDVSEFSNLSQSLQKGTAADFFIPPRQILLELFSKI